MKTLEEIQESAIAKYGTGIYSIDEIDAYVVGYTQCQENNKDKVYTEEDIKNAFKAGDKYRLYLDKWATGIATEGLPDVTMIHKTMSENAFINSLNK